MEFYWKQNPKGNFGFFTTPLCYSNALDILESETLDKRRVKLCKNFARKAFLHPKYQNWFCQRRKEEKIKKTRGQIGKLM